MEALLWALLAMLVVIALLSAFSANAKYEKEARALRESAFDEVLARHISVLARKRGQLVVRDDYGREDATKWEAEVEYFFLKVFVPEYMDAIMRHPDAKLLGKIHEKLTGIEGAEVYKRIEAQVREHERVNPSSGLLYSPQMSPVEYERLCAERLASAGWSTKLTPATGDQGADVIAESGNLRLVVQCKLYGQPVGNKAVQEVFAAKTYQRAAVAAVVSNQTYTPHARRLAKANGVCLLHHDELHAFTPELARSAYTAP